MVRPQRDDDAGAKVRSHPRHSRGPARHNGTVLIPKPLWQPIADGEVTLAFRRWKRLLVKPGQVYRTGAGRIRVTTVDVIEPSQITDADARRSGSESAAAVMAQLQDREGDVTYRIEFEHLDEPDPRTRLANESDLTADDVAEITRRLDRLDRASSLGPWTRRTLELIEAHPERRAPDLAEMLGRQTQPFKVDVRKLKNMGLTISFRIGYRLSPRGEAYLRGIEL